MKNKSKRNKKNKVWYLLVAIVVIFVATASYFFITSSDDSNHLTLLERRWINENKDTLIDIKVPSNLSILAYNGEGVIFDFLTEVEEKTELSFNKVAYTYPDNYADGLGILILDSDDKLMKDDIYLLEDHYVLVGKDQGFIESNNLVGNKIGVLESDYEVINNYFSNALTLNRYTSYNTMQTALRNNSINYFIVPRYVYLENINNDNLYIKYNFKDLANKLVLRPSGIKRLDSILEKYVTNFRDELFIEDLNKNLLNYYLSLDKITELERVNLTNKVYRYGYVKGSNYNIKVRSDHYGIANSYLQAMEEMIDMEFDYFEYNSQEELLTALRDEKIDFAFVDFNYDGSLLKTVSPFNSDMVVLSKKYYPITSQNSLNNRNIYVKENSPLKNYISNFTNNISSYKGSNIPSVEEDLLVVDNYDYQYYKDGKLKSYQVLFKDNYTSNCYYVVNNNQEVFYNFLNFFLSNSDNSIYEQNTIKQFDTISNSRKNFENIYIVITLIVIIPLLLIIMILFVNRKKVKGSSKKEDVLKYNDLLTSLKNRNYLNDCIEKWDDTHVYPKTVIMVDLNNLKYVNDNYGHEEGNKLIQSAAAVLINTQLEKSEIIRTDGNEFLIYLIGYSKMQVTTYVNKLSREFEKLEHGFGAAIGYSMIEDEIKTIDDAINEATINMRMDKEQNYR